MRTMLELASLFLDPASAAAGGLGVLQVAFQVVFLAAPLVYGAKLMADGADLLTLTLDATFVCAVVVPLLGALPDAFIILFSALGPDAQAQINVGMGTLAGSTNVLVTAAVLAAVWCGAVDVRDRVPVGYTRRPKLSGSVVGRLGASGVVLSPAVLRTSVVMLACTLPYIVAQAVAFAYGGADTNTAVAYVVFVAAAACLVAFVAYQYLSATAAALARTRRELLVRAKSSAVSLEELMAVAAAQAATAAHGGGDAEAALTGGGAAAEAVDAALRALFRSADVDKNGTLDAAELGTLLTLCSRGKAPVESSVVEALLQDDTVAGADAKLDPDEWVAFAFQWFDRKQQHSTRQLLTAKPVEVDEDDEDEDGDDGGGSDQPRAALLTRAARLLVVGLVLVTLFSDPMVAAVAELATRIHVPAFYVAYVVNPLVSNASELIAMAVFVARRTPKSADMAINTLLGAATMNNTLGAAVLMALVAVRGLTWEFSAEVVSIVAAQGALVVALLTAPPVADKAARGAGGRLLYASTALGIGALYVGALGLVWALESIAGWN